MEIIASNEKKLNMEGIIIIILIGFYQIRRYEDLTYTHTPYRFAAMKYHAL
jgi:hypothetical protein